MTKKTIEAVDLFCGAGGLSLGLKNAGITVKAGIDIDPACQYPYTENIGAAFILKDVSTVTGDELRRLYSKGALKLLAGCAPCQPFSTLANTCEGTGNDAKWGLLEQFARLVEELKPDYVSMENVPRVTNHRPYRSFLSALESMGYTVNAGSVRCADFGIPQERRRFVLLAALKGAPKLPEKDAEIRTVRQAISHLPKIDAGKTDPNDPLHKARTLTPINLRRIRASKPGGTWMDWPKSLRAPCHKVESGESYKSVYARMSWDLPSPTITTQAFNFGTGRFGHPEQDRALSLREAAILQSFPDNYQFVPPGESVTLLHVGRLIGNAVPPKLGEAVGRAFTNLITKKNV